MKTIWALASALCLAVQFAQAAPTADVVQDVGNGVNQISEKSAEVPILSSEVEVDVATPILVSRVSTLLTAATPAIYQDAAKNPSESLFETSFVLVDDPSSVFEGVSLGERTERRRDTVFSSDEGTLRSFYLPDELSERIVKPITLLLNSVSGGVTTLAKDNSRRFFVPSFVRFNFRQDALLELDRIRRTERFWNETEQYVDSVCARLKKYIEVQRRRGAHGAPAPTTSTTTSTSTASPSSVPTLTATTAQTKPFPTSFHVGVKSDLKLSIQESAEPIKIPIVDLPDRRRPPHPLLRPRPTPAPHATVQTAPLKEPAAEVLAPKPINAVESIESTSAAPSEVPVETTPVPSKVEPSSTTTQRVPELTTVAEAVVTAEPVAVTEESTPVAEVPKVLSAIDVKVPEEQTPGPVVTDTVPAESIVSSISVPVPAVESRSSLVPQPEQPVPEVAAKEESAPEPIVIAEAKTSEAPQVAPAAEQDARSGGTPIDAPEEKSSPVTNVVEEPSVAVVPQVESATPEVVPAVDVKAAEVPQTSSTAVPVSSESIEPAAVGPVDVKPSEQTPVVVTTSAAPPVETTTSQLPVVDPVVPVTKIGAEVVPPVEVTTAAVVPSSVSTEVAQPTQPELVTDSVVASTPAVAAPIVPESVVVPAVETASTLTPKAEVSTTTVPEVFETSSAATAAPVVQSSTSVPQLTFTSSAPKPVPEIVSPPALPDISAAESSVVPVAVQTPFPEVVTPTETTVKSEPVVIPSTESTIVASDVAGTARPNEESHPTLSQDATTIQQNPVTTAKPAAGEVHRVHPVTSSIVFPSKAPPKISQSVNVQQFGVSSSSSPENPLTFVSSTTVTTSRSDSSKSTIEALRFEQVALSHPIVIRPVKSPLPIAIPHRVIKHSSDGVSVVRTHSTGTITGPVEISSR